MIIISAGHVDHGKTAIIKALTGRDTAHLPEEKKRGLTIDLGYAYLPLVDHTIGFIDVPGHEKFLTNMLAGFGGVKHAMLVVAADEGVKPQTTEHLSILKLLNIHHLFVVITKADKADSQQISHLISELKNQFSLLVNSRFFVTSSYTGEGIQELKNYLKQLHDTDINQQQKPFRYAIDRVFSMKGAGTVVTGTALSGSIEIGQSVILSSANDIARIRGIHAQNQVSEQGIAGERLALNLLTNTTLQSIKRGDWIFSESNAVSYDRFTLEIIADRPLKESQAIHLFHAASHTIATLNILSQKNVALGETVLAEVILQQPLFMVYGDRVVLRSGDNSHCIAGGRILEINSSKRYKRNEARLNYLTQLALSEHVEDRINLYLSQKIRTVNEICWLEQLTEQQFMQLSNKLSLQQVDGYCFNQHFEQQYKQKILETVAQFHLQHGDQQGLSRGRLHRMSALQQPYSIIAYLFNQLIQNKELEETRGWIHLPDHRLSFSNEEKIMWQKVEAEFKKKRGAIWVRDMAIVLSTDEKDMRSFMYKAGKLGYLVAIVKDRFFFTEDIYYYCDIIRQHIDKDGSISVNQLRDELEFGRKLTVQLIEYLDQCGFLWRKGNVHVLRDTSLFSK